MMGLDLRELQRQSWNTSESKGFHEAMLNLSPEDLATYLKILLTIGELSEAAEEIRNGHSPTELYYEYHDERLPETSFTPVYYLYDRNARTERVVGDVEPEVIHGKPCGFGIELSDVLIRLCDLAEDVGVDLSEVTEIKAAYNKTREKMHGGKTC